MSNLYKEIEIGSSLDNLYKVERFVEEICDHYYINNTYFGNILISIEEAVKNAIIHGNKNDNHKKVKISFKRIANSLSFVITDHGEGFNYMTVPNPIDPEQTENKPGNGLFLIRSLADKVIYNKKGNAVEILFYISSINQETTLTRINKMNQYFMKQKTIA